MKISFELNIEGAEEAASRLRDTADSISRGIADALRQGAELIVNYAQANAPVDTGYLRDHIEISEESDTSVTVVSGAEYSGFVEHGTSKMAAQPFFEPAIEQARGEIEQLLRNAISAGG
jgi:HK97 gp10 family phage protein